MHFTDPIPPLNFADSIRVERLEFTKDGRWLKVPGKDGMTVHIPSGMCIIEQKEPMR